jgi:hypothetical protein
MRISTLKVAYGSKAEGSDRANVSRFLLQSRRKAFKSTCPKCSSSGLDKLDGLGPAKAGAIWRRLLAKFHEATLRILPQLPRHLACKHYRLRECGERNGEGGMPDASADWAEREAASAWRKTCVPLKRLMRTRRVQALLVLYPDQENAHRQQDRARLGGITTSWLAESPPGSCRASPPVWKCLWFSHSRSRR